PALARVRVGAIIVRTAAAREADARPVQAAQASARCAATRRTRAERLRTSGRRPGILGTQPGTRHEQAEHTRQGEGGSCHGVHSSSIRRTPPRSRARLRWVRCIRGWRATGGIDLPGLLAQPKLPAAADGPVYLD